LQRCISQSLQSTTIGFFVIVFGAEGRQAKVYHFVRSEAESHGATFGRNRNARQKNKL
jgi:hypothetical protein